MGGCKLFQDKDKRLSNDDEKISMAVIWNEIKHVGEMIKNMQQSLDNLPCDDLSERVVRLEEKMKTREKAGAVQEEGIQGAYDLIRTEGKESFGRWWKVGIVLLGAGLALLNGLLFWRLS